MSVGFGGSSSSQHATNAFTMPQKQLAGTPFAAMLPGMLSGVNQLLSGSALTSASSAVTKASNMNLTTGIQGLKSAFAGSGMAQSSDLMRGINQMTQQAGINLASVIAPMTLESIQSGIGDVLNMAAGTGNQWGSQFGWNAGASIGYASPGGTVGIGAAPSGA